MHRMLAPQHKPVVATLILERFGRKDLCSTETRIRSGKLNGAVIERFQREVLEQQPKSRECRNSGGRVEGI